MIGTTELIIIAAVILVLFGATAIPCFARSLGKAKRELARRPKEGQEGEEAEASGEKQTDRTRKRGGTGKGV
jgi:sec-independent protein translocase protein TatA